MRRFSNISLILVLCLALPLPVWAQAPIAVTLLWDHPGTGVDAFYLERRIGQQQSGAYTPVPLTIPGTARQITDMVPPGTIHCWRLLAGLAEFRSEPSNEVCHAVVQAPITLRVMQ